MLVLQCIFSMESLLGYKILCAYNNSIKLWNSIKSTDCACTLHIENVLSIKLLNYFYCKSGKCALIKWINVRRVSTGQASIRMHKIYINLSMWSNWIHSAIQSFNVWYAVLTTMNRCNSFIFHQTFPVIVVRKLYQAFNIVSVECWIICMHIWVVGVENTGDDLAVKYSSRRKW